MLRTTISITFVLCFLGSTYAGIAVQSAYSYDQQGPLSFAGSEEVVGDIERTVTLPNAIYKFDIEANGDDIYELKSRAKIEANIDGRAINGFSGDGWSSTTVSAFSSAQLIDTTFVDGVQGEVGGIVEFLWAVTGASTITMTPKLQSDAYVPTQLFTTAFFNTIEDSTIPELLLNDQSRSSVGPGVTSTDSTQPGFFAPVVAFVDWVAGEELAVFFELQTSARLSVQNLDAAGFDAVVDSDFSNTAVLQEIRIYDDLGNLIPEAYLRSTEDDFIYDPQNLGLGMDDNGGMDNGGMDNGGMDNGGDPNPVPEPTTIMIWGVLAGLLGVREARRRRR